MNMKNVIDYYIGLSPSIKSSLIITLILCITILVLSRKLKKHHALQVPAGTVLVSELLVGSINQFSDELMGSHGKKYAPFILTLAIFIFISNISGLFGFHPPTANIAVTFALGVLAGFVIQVAGVRSQGWKNYLKGFLEPSAIMLPLNIVSELLTPFSLGMRLFGNIFSGAVIMGMIYTLFTNVSIGIIPVGAVLTSVITPAFHAIFDIFFGFIQTFVFILLTGVFISGKLPDEN